jgi:hypothetical protein
MNDIYPLTKHINQTTDRIDAALDGWTLGVLVIEDGRVELQLDDNSLIPVPTGAVLEIKNGSGWEPLANSDLRLLDRYGWPLFAGLDARMK